jgi:hypothetical protein
VIGEGKNSVKDDILIFTHESVGEKPYEIKSVWGRKCKQTYLSEAT